VQSLQQKPDRHSGEALQPQVSVVAAAAAASVPSEERTKVVSNNHNNNKNNKSASKAVTQVNGHSASPAPTVTSKPPAGPKSWSSLFKKSSPSTAAAAAAISPAAHIHTQSQTHSAQKSSPNQKMYRRVCLGGTFDTIHEGHRRLLNQSLSQCSECLTIGVTDESMIRKKTLWELIAPVEERIAAVRLYCENYLKDNSRTGLKLNIVPISDPFGPAITDTSLEAIIVSDETIGGAEKINLIRTGNNMSALQVVSVRLVEAKNKECSEEEDKISSSTLRMRKLGTLLKEPPASSSKLATRPYLIGLTGGIASGKTSISNEFKKLGAGIIDCDKVAHQTYRPGSHVYDKIVREFGRDVVDVKSSEILRNKLGAKIFGNAAAKAKLESLVWPETSRLVFQEAERLRVQEKKEVVIVEAAQIIEAKWTDRLHQVWVTMIPEEVAIKRVMERNSLSEKEAKQRISSQMTNKERVSHANVVFSTLWDREFTRAQVQKAWNMLHKRFLRAV
jgi:phosphopantetheine adenylyltransferase/dephospho-CoA kinase